MRKSDETKEVHNPHDKGYKKDLSKPREFIHFLKKYVGADWMMGLEESQLLLCDKEFFDKDYEGREADLIYQVKKANGEEIYIFILQELQSTVDYTMIFRVVMYVVNTLLRYFLNTEKSVREQSSFRLSAMVPIVFYNGEDTWTAVTNFREYQEGGKLFGEHVLNLEYYLVNLSAIDEGLILSTNTVLDNIMYCDKFRKKQELIDVLREAYQRVDTLGNQEKEEFNDWVRTILLAICDGKEAVAEEIFRRLGNGVEDMAFKYNIVKMFEDERAANRAEGRAEGHAEGRAEGHAEGELLGTAKAVLNLLEEFGSIPDDIRTTIMVQTDLDILTSWLKSAAKAQSIEEWKNLVSWCD